MKVTVVGSGAIGLYYGAHLMRAGHRVSFLMRSGFELADRGIRVFSGADSFQTGPLHAARTTEELGPSEVIIISVKTTSNADLEHLIPPLLAPGTLLLTLQNGLGNEEFLAARFGKHRVLGGLCFVCLTRRDPVTVDEFGRGTLSLGEYSGGAAGAADLLASYFREAGIEASAVPNLLAARWRKLVWNIPFNGLSVVAGGLSVDRILADPVLRNEAEALMHETIAVAAGDGCQIGEGFIAHQFERTMAMGPYKPSTLVDWEAGRPLEIEPIWGEPARRAAQHNIAVPKLSHLYTKMLEAAARPHTRAGQ